MGARGLMISLLLPLFLFESIKGDAQPIHDTCSNTSDPRFCSATLRSDPRFLKKNLTGIEEQLLVLTSNDATALFEDIADLLRKAFDAYTRDCLQICRYLYEDSSYILLLATDDLKAKSADGVEGKLMEALRNAGKCEICFTEKRGYSSPLTKKNEHQAKLVGLGLDILKILAKQL